MSYCLIAGSISSQDLWTPDAEPLTTLWVDFSNSSYVRDTAGKVYSVDNIGANASALFDTMDQGTGASQPTTGTRTIGGTLNAIDFDGTTEYLDDTDGWVDMQSSPEIIVCMVVETDSFATPSAILSASYSSHPSTELKIGGSSGNYEVLGRNSGANLFASGTLLTIGAATPGVTEIISYRASSVADGGGHKSIAYMGGAKAVGDVNQVSYDSLSTMSHLRIGANRDNSAAYQWPYNGAVGEIVAIIGRSDLDTLQKVEGYLAWKWNGVSRLDASHPYKSTQPKL